MSSRSDLHVTVSSPPRRGGRLIGVPRLGILRTFADAWMAHQ